MTIRSIKPACRREMGVAQGPHQRSVSKVKSAGQQDAEVVKYKLSSTQDLAGPASETVMRSYIVRPVSGRYRRRCSHNAQVSDDFDSKFSTN